MLDFTKTRHEYCGFSSDQVYLNNFRSFLGDLSRRISQWSTLLGLIYDVDVYGLHHFPGKSRFTDLVLYNRWRIFPCWQRYFHLFGFLIRNLGNSLLTTFGRILIGHGRDCIRRIPGAITPYGPLGLMRPTISNRSITSGPPRIPFSSFDGRIQVYVLRSLFVDLL